MFVNVVAQHDDRRADKNAHGVKKGVVYQIKAFPQIIVNVESNVNGKRFGNARRCQVRHCFVNVKQLNDAFTGSVLPLILKRK